MGREARPISRFACRWTGILCGALLACGIDPWVSAAPVTFRPAEGETYLIVARCMARAQELGYSVKWVDYDGGSLRLAALRTDAVMLGIRPVPRSSSWLLVKVEGDRTVSVRAYGDLVLEESDWMHPGLRAEMDWLAGELERAISNHPRTSDGEPEGDPS
jgi:hypothetical protein